MKKFRFLLALVLVCAFVSSIAMAAAPAASVAGVTSGEMAYESGDVVVSLQAEGSYDIDSFYAEIVFDKTKWTVNGTPTTEIASANAVVNEMTGTPKAGYLDMTSVTDGKVFLKAVFSPIDGQDVDGSSFRAILGGNDQDYEPFDETIIDFVVKKSAPGPVVEPKIDVTKNAEEIAEAIEENSEEYGAEAFTVEENGDKLYDVYTADLSFVASDADFAVKILGKEGVAFKLFTDSRITSDGATVEFKLALMGVGEEEAAAMKNKISFLFGESNIETAVGDINFVGPIVDLAD